MLTAKIESLAGYFILLSGWRRSLAAVLAGGVSALSMPPFDLVFVPFFTFAILVWLIDGVASDPASGIRARLWGGFKPGFFFGFGYFVCGMWWIGNALLVESEQFAWALPLAITVIPAVLAVFWGFASALARLFWSDDTRRLFVLAACFALAEYARGHVATGLPWNAISYAAYFTPVLMQSASVVGIYGMTAFSVLVFSAGGAIVPGASKTAYGRRVMFALALGLIGLHVGYGIWRLPTHPAPTVEGVSLRLVQPAIDQREKWKPENEQEIFNRYLSLSTTATAPDKQGLSGTTHLIWPESAFPFLLTERRDALAAISAMLPDGTSLITGAARVERAATQNASGFVFNSVYVVDGDGEIAAAADKVHLVPFGEYLPFQEFAESLGLQQLTGTKGGFEPGSSRKLISTGIGPKFLPMICYEIIFSGEIWSGNQRPGWILNLTNDAWFGRTPGPYQHLRQSIIRGVEEGLPVIRVANSGISVVSDAYGRIVKEIPLGTRGVVDSPLPAHVKRTIFAQYGGWILWITCVLFFATGLFPLRKSGTGHF